MLKLFNKPGAVSLASYIALEETGADFEIVPIDFKAGEQRTPEYLALNPLGRVPTLVTERGVLTETMAILTYIARAFPDARLAPEDPWDFAQMLSVMSYLASTVHVSTAHMNRGYRWADDADAIAEMRRKAPGVIADNLRLLEDRIGAGPWVLGAQYTVADPHLFVMTWWAERDGVPLAPFPNLRAHLARMQARAAVRKVLAREGLSPR
jgi:glutathione S-transferase